MTAATATQVTVPDIGDFTDVPVIEIHVSAGDTIAVDDPLLTLESDKATMDVPSSHAGTVGEVLVSVGDTVSEGTAVITVDTGDGSGGGDDGGGDDGTDEPDEADQTGQDEAGNEAGGDAEGSSGGSDAPDPVIDEKPGDGQPASSGSSGSAESSGSSGSSGSAGSAGSSGPAGNGTSAPHAGPSVRKRARELGIDLAQVPATGPKGRITTSDLEAFAGGSGGGGGEEDAAPAPAVADKPAESGSSGSSASASSAPSGGSGIPEIPAQDFSKFGPVERHELSRITRISGPALHRSWLNVPHVTHSDDADITEVDKYRKELDTQAKEEGYRVTLLAFLLKASVSALKAYPTVNSSLSPEKDALILKHYYHLGVAVDTPGGLVVPVLRDVDRKGIVELSKELGEISARARDGKLTPDDMAGATFTISSLGGIGGTNFTPIVNAPQVAILGVVRSRVAPVWDGTEFRPRTLLPLCLSYDHRVVDGALAARFVAHLAHTLGDERRLLL